MYCKRCGYSLQMLASASCPECGQPFDAAKRSTYTTHPRLAKWTRRLVRITVWLAVVLLALLTSLISWMQYGYEREQEMLVKLGIPIFRDAPTVGHAQFDDLLPDYAPQWLQDLPFNSRVIIFNFDSMQLDDDDLRLIGKFSKLQVLILGVIGKQPHFTSKGLQRLSELDLESLHLDIQNVDCDGLQFLEGMQSLSSLWMMECKVCPDALQSLMRLRSLTWLILYDCSIDDKGVEILSRLSNLHTIDLSGNPITDASIDALCNGFPGIGSIQLDDTLLSESGLQQIIAKRGGVIEINPP